MNNRVPPSGKEPNHNSFPASVPVSGIQSSYQSVHAFFITDIKRPLLKLSKTENGGEKEYSSVFEDLARVLDSPE